MNWLVAPRQPVWDALSQKEIRRMVDRLVSLWGWAQSQLGRAIPARAGRAGRLQGDSGAPATAASLTSHDPFFGELHAEIIPFAGMRLQAMEGRAPEKVDERFTDCEEKNYAYTRKKNV
jgi:hypothetical protein